MLASYGVEAWSLADDDDDEACDPNTVSPYCWLRFDCQSGRFDACISAADIERSGCDDGNGEEEDEDNADAAEDDG